MVKFFVFHPLSKKPIVADNCGSAGLYIESVTTGHELPGSGILPGESVFFLHPMFNNHNVAKAKAVISFKLVFKGQDFIYIRSPAI